MFAWLDKFLELRSIAKAEREANRPREWLFVNAYGSEQARPGVPMSYSAALDFLKEHVACPFVMADQKNSIIFFDGRKLSRQN